MNNILEFLLNTAVNVLIICIIWKVAKFVYKEDEDVINNTEGNFAEWLALKHYRLHNVSKGICYWKNEESEKTTEELYKEFINEN